MARWWVHISGALENSCTSPGPGSAVPGPCDELLAAACAVTPARWDAQPDLCPRLDEVENAARASRHPRHQPDRHGGQRFDSTNTHKNSTLPLQASPPELLRSERSGTQSTCLAAHESV